MIKAIETPYHGYRFRSRLEARFAVIFDELNIPWSYEREGFSLPSGPYLPDFAVRYEPSPPKGVAVDDPLLQPGPWHYVEIKGQFPTSVEDALCCELSTESKVDLLFGEFDKFGLVAYRDGSRIDVVNFPHSVLAFLQFALDYTKDTSKWDWVSSEAALEESPFTLDEVRRFVSPFWDAVDVVRGTRFGVV